MYEGMSSQLGKSTKKSIPGRARCASPSWIKKSAKIKISTLTKSSKAVAAGCWITSSNAVGFGRQEGDNCFVGFREIVVRVLGAGFDVFFIPFRIASVKRFMEQRNRAFRRRKVPPDNDAIRYRIDIALYTTTGKSRETIAKRYIVRRFKDSLVNTCDHFCLLLEPKLTNSTTKTTAGQAAGVARIRYEVLKLGTGVSG